MENRKKFATTPPYPDSVFDSVAYRMPFRLPVHFLGKVVADSKDFPFKKLAVDTNPANDRYPPEGERAKYTHGYFQLEGIQGLLELVLAERNTALRPDGRVTWQHSWILRPQIIVPWEIPGISSHLELERSHEELHFNFIIDDWQIRACTGPGVGNREPHRADGDFQVTTANIGLGTSWQENETYGIPDRVINLVGQIVLASRMLVYGCRGKYHSLNGLLKTPTAELYLECAESFRRQFPILKLLEHCLDPTQCELEYKQGL